MLWTSSIISKIKSIQGALSVIAMLNMNGYLFPPDYDISSNNAYDYVVIGGGIGGSVVAARLVEAGYTVLILEAGGIYNLDSLFPGVVTYVKNSPVDWNYTAEIDHTGKCHDISDMLIPKVLGGAGATDFMFYGRGNPSNYAKWSEITGDDSWNWDNMTKYFKKTEALEDPEILNSPYRQYHGTGGKLRITRDPNDVCDKYIKGFKLAGEQTPIENIGNGSLGYSRALFNIVEGYRYDPGVAYLNPLKENNRLHVSLLSLATKIIFDEHNSAVGVEFQKNGTKFTVRVTKEVIVSAGPIKSPQLLMLSGIGPEEELNKWKVPVVSNLPVGKNLQTIIGTLLIFKTKYEANPEPFNAHKFVTPLVVGYGACNKSSVYPDYETLNCIIDDYDYFLSFCGFTLGFKKTICDKLYLLAKNTQSLSVVLSNLNIKSRGEITLKSTDPEDSPKINTAYYSNEKDLDAMAAYIQDYMKIVSTPYFKHMGLEFIEATASCFYLIKDSREYWKCYAKCMTANINRYVGSNSMGSVVDNRLCVKGVNSLRVVDASVIPTVIGGPTSAAIVALAEKAAEIIVSDAKL